MQKLCIPNVIQKLVCKNTVFKENGVSKGESSPFDPFIFKSANQFLKFLGIFHLFIFLEVRYYLNIVLRHLKESKKHRILDIVRCF